MSFAGTKRYRVVRPLGVGGMGEVYEVEDTTTAARVALKVMLAADPRRLLRFKQEFRLMAELHHPNLVRLFDLATEDGQWFFTMELVHGQDVLHVLSTAAEVDSSASTADEPVAAAAVAAARADAAPVTVRPGPACEPDQLLMVLAQILDALEALHDRGVVHRDIKPSNVMVDVDGRVRVLDFGLASRIDRIDAISQDGVVVGTLAYLAPEQLAGSPATPASDLYALGVLLFQVLTGALPFRDGLAAAMAGRIDQPPRVDARVAGVAPELVDLVHRLMALEPADRPTLDEVRAALGLARGALSDRRTARAAADTPSSDHFVGRAAELATLAGCLERARDGRPQLALVSGPSGIGKSALADQLLRRAAPLGFLAFRGRSYEREQVPFVAFDRIMDAVTLALQRWPAERLAPLRVPLAALARIFPALALLADRNAPAPAAADPRELRWRAFDGFVRLLAHCQAEAPLLLVLDDLQWADDESLALLEVLLAGGAGRIAILALARPDGAAEHPLEPLVRRLAPAGPTQVVRVTLAAMDVGEAMEIVDTVGGGRLDPGTARALADQAGGNPFMVRRLAEHLVGLASDDRVAALDASGSTDDVLREMIGALSPRAEQVLALAATAGGDVPAPLLRDASGMPAADFDLAAGELITARFLKAVPSRTDAPRVDLYHDRIREVVYRGLADDRRSSLHRDLALTLQARSTEYGHDAEALARHWGEAGDRPRRRRFAIEAAELAIAKLAFRRAAGLLRVVQGDPDPDEPAAITSARWEQIGELCEYSGGLADAAGAYREALALWDALPDDPGGARRLARLRLRGLAGASQVATGQVVEGRAMFEAGLALLGLPLERSLAGRVLTLLHLTIRDRFAGTAGAGVPDPWTAAQVRFFDVMMRAFQPLWPLTAAEATLRAALLGRRTADHTARVRALAFTAVATVRRRVPPATLARAGRLLDEAEAVVQAHAVPLGAEIVQLNRALLWLAVNPARARRASERALAGLERLGMYDSYDSNPARAQYLLILYFKGDHDDALVTAEYELAPSRSDVISVTFALVVKARILAVRGQLAEADEALGELRARTAGLPVSMLSVMVSLTAATVQVAQGRFAEALAGEAGGEREARSSGAWLAGLLRAPWIEVMLEAALGLARQGRLDSRTCRRADRWARWLATHGVLDYGCMGDRALALLDHERGRHRAARRALDRALAHSAVGTSPHHRWLCLEAARDLGRLNLDLAAEAEELAALGRFTLPPGWRTLAGASP